MSINHQDVSVFIFLHTSPQTSTGDSSTSLFACLFLWIGVFAFGPLIATDSVHAAALQTHRIGLCGWLSFVEELKACTNAQSEGELSFLGMFVL